MKKSFDTESMYNKIMPSSINSEKVESSSLVDAKEKMPGSPKPSADAVVLRNIMEILVKDKTDLAFEKIECCKCEKCINEIYATALNQLAPKYVAGTETDIKREVITYSSTNLMEVNTIVLRAVLAVKKNPPH